jgi:hypothetical protein
MPLFYFSKPHFLPALNADQYPERIDSYYLRRQCLGASAMGELTMIIKVIITCCALVVPVAASAADGGQDGMTVVRDKLTGKLRAPTSAELHALRGQLMKPETAMTPVQPTKSTVRPDGTRAIHLGERGMVYAVMRRNDDGSLTGHCVKGEQAAADAIGKKQENGHDQL